MTGTSLNVTEKKKSLANIVLILASSIVCLFACEWVLVKYVPRIKTHSEYVGLESSPYPAAFSAYLPFTLPANGSFHHKTSEFDVVYDFNKFGYRGAYPEQISKLSTKKRILMIGDSFTLGWGNEFDNTFVQQIQNYLKPMNYELINAAYHAGCSPDSYYAYLVREGLKLAPEMVIVVLYSGNDVADMQDNKWLEIDQRGAPLQVDTIRLYTDYQGNLLHPEKLEARLPWNYKIPTLNEVHVFIAVTQVVNKFLPNFSFFAKSVALGRTESSLPEEEGWKRFGIIIEAMSGLSKDNGLDLVYVLIPPDPKRVSVQDRTYERMSTIIESQPDARLVCIKPYITGQAYFDEDAHFNELGNRITAQKVIELLWKEP